MSINEFVSYHNLKATDALVLTKKFLGMVDHYVLFMGYRGNQPVFIANYTDGVKEISNNEVSYYLKKYQPRKIERFPGTHEERIEAFKRAISRVGERAYNFFANNCEHFKNWVHFGENYSKQVNVVGNIGLGAGGTLVAAGLATNNTKAAIWGLGLLFLGAILKGAAQHD